MDPSRKEAAETGGLCRTPMPMPPGPPGVGGLPALAAAKYAKCEKGLLAAAAAAAAASDAPGPPCGPWVWAEWWCMWCAAGPPTICVGRGEPTVNDPTVLYGWPAGPTFSCFLHFARLFWNQTWKKKGTDQ